MNARSQLTSRIWPGKPAERLSTLKPEPPGREEGGLRISAPAMPTRRQEVRRAQFASARAPLTAIAVRIGRSETAGQDFRRSWDLRSLQGVS